MTQKIFKKNEIEKKLFSSKYLILGIVQKRRHATNGKWNQQLKSQS
jgi:hypothetical protein